MQPQMIRRLTSLIRASLTEGSCGDPGLASTEAACVSVGFGRLLPGGSSIVNGAQVLAARHDQERWRGQASDIVAPKGLRLPIPS